MKTTKSMAPRAVLAAAMCLVSGWAYGQQWQWALQTGGYARATGIARDQAGNIYFTGYFWSPTLNIGGILLTNSGTNTADIFLAKCAPNSHVLWARRAGGTGNDWGRGVAVDAAGHVYLTGYFRSASAVFGDIIATNFGTNTSDIVLIQYDSDGNIKWLRQAGGSGEDLAVAVAVDAAGDVALSGAYDSARATFGNLTLTNTGQHTFFIAKYNSSGQAVWARQTGGNSLGEGSGVAIDQDGNVCVAGWFHSSTIMLDSITLTNQGSYDVFLAKYTAEGQVAWARGAGGTGEEGPNALAVDAAGNVLVTGDFYSTTLKFDSLIVTNSSTNYNDMFIAKYSPSGKILWAQSAGGTSYDAGRGVATDTNGSVYLSGFFSSPFLPLGNTTLTNSGYNAFLNPDLFLVKYDADGRRQWAATARGLGTEDVESLIPDEWGNVYVTGFFDSYPLFSSVYLNNTGDYDAFVAKYSPVTPVFLTQPQSVTAEAGTKVTFTLVATSPRPLSYQWFKDDAPVVGETNTTLVLPQVTTNDAGIYAAMASDSLSSAVSAKAALTVIPLPQLYLSISNGLAKARLQAASGNLYDLQSCSVLQAVPSWATLTTLGLTNSVQDWQDPEPANKPQRFYRALRRP